MEQVRLFVSSTFRDMHAERDRLNRFVFPELRSRCARRGIEFIGVDLRWGVTSEAARMRGTTRICLDEIDRCRPFFLGLLGQRRGWVPPLEELNSESFRMLQDASESDAAALELVNHWYARDETARTPVWRVRSDVALPLDVAEHLTRLSIVAGVAGAGESLTAREIEHGAFGGSGNVRSFLYIRQPGYLDAPEFPASFRDVFVERSKADEEALAQLIRSLRARATTNSVVRDYSVSYEGLRIDPTLVTVALSAVERDHLRDGVIQPNEWPALSDALQEALRDHGTVALNGLDTWGDQVTDDVWRAIEEEIGERTRRVTSSTPPDAHELFIAERTRLFFGREDSLERMTSYLESPRVREPLVITGAPGSGKSAVMAEFVRRSRTNAHARRAAVIVPFFVGAAPDSTTLIPAIRSILTKLRDACSLRLTIPSSAADIRTALAQFLERAGERHQVILVIDALDQLDPAAGSHELDWLPARLPRGVRVIVSALAGDTLDHLHERSKPERIVELPSLDRDDRTKLIEVLLEQRGKQLTPEQLAPLLDVGARADVALPLYLRVALEELTLFGDYAALSARIAALPVTVRELFDQVLARLESDHGADLVERVLGALAASRNGLTEAELLDLLAESLPSCTRLDFTRLYRAITAYIRPHDEASGSGLIGFYHDQLRRAVNRRYFGMVDTDTTSPGLAARHAELAAHFARNRGTARGVSEIVWQKLRAGDWGGAEDTLCDLRFIEDKVRAGMTLALEADYDDALTSIPPERVDGDRGAMLRAFDDFVTSESHNFNRWESQPGFCIQQAYNSADAGPVGEASDDVVRDVRGKIPMQLCHPSYRAQYDPTPVILRTLIPGERGPEGQDSSGVAVTGDGSLAISTFDCDLVVWDLRTGRRIRKLNDDAGFAQCIAVSHDGRVAVSGHGDNTLCVWDVRTGTCVRRLRGHTDRPATVAITPDSRLAVSGGSFDDHTVRLWDVGNGNCVGTFEQDDEVSAVAISHDGGVIASVDQGGALRIAELATGKVRVHRGPSYEKRPLAISPDSRFLIVGHENRMFQVRELPGGRRVRYPDRGVEELSAAFRRSPNVAVTSDGRFVVTATNFAMCMWDIRTLECVRHVSPPTGLVSPTTQLCLPDDPSRAITVSYDGVVNVWDLAEGAHPPTEAEVNSTEHVEAVTFQADGRRAIALHRDGAIAWHDVRKGWGLHATPRGLRYARSIALSVDAGRLVAAAASKLLLYEIRNDAPFRPRPLEGDTGLVQALATSPDGRTVISGADDKQIRVWDLVTRKTTRVLVGHSDGIQSLAMAADGCLLLSGCMTLGSNRDTVALWNLRTGKRLRLLRVTGEQADGSAVALSPDGRFAVSGGVGGQIDMWDTRTGHRLHKLLGHTDSIQGLSFTADGVRLVSAARDQTTRVWNVANGACEHVCVHPFNPLSLAMRGRHVIVGGQVGNTRLLELSGMTEGPAIVTASRPYEFAHARQAPRFLIYCPWCSRTQRTSGAMLDVIREFAVRGTGAPVIAVPPSGFSDARLLTVCGYCKGELRYNPFVVGGEPA